MKRRFLVLLAATPFVGAAIVSPASSAAATGTAGVAARASASTASPADEAFRSQLAAYLQGLGDAVNTVASNPVTAANALPHTKDEQGALKAAQAQLSQLSAPQLQAMEAVLGKNPNWQQQPVAIKQAVATLTAKAPARRSAAVTALPGYLSGCTGSAADLKGLYFGSWAAAQVAGAANAVASGLPDGADFTPALIVAGVLYGVANGIFIGLQADLTLGLDCATATFNTTLETTFPTDASVTGFTPASSQASVDKLAAVTGGVKTTLDSIQSTINTTTGKLAAVINSLGIAQGTANSIQATATDLQSRTDALLTTIGTAADATTGTANGLANTINAKADTILGSTASFQTLDTRMEIERALANPGSPVVTLFALPASQGGFLEVARDITAQTISNELAAGQSVGNAQLFQSRGNTALAAGQFQAAWVQYGLAYTTAVR